MAMATSRRVILLARFYDTSTRVFTVSSTLIASRNYENETWCRSRSHISQRNISITARSFQPKLSTIVMRHIDGTKDPGKTTKTSDKAVTLPISNEITVEYQHGLPKITVPLQSRKERCHFVLKPISNTIGDFIEMLKLEDPGIDRVAVTTIDDIRIAKSNTIEHLLQSDFRFIINDVVYLVQPPLNYKRTMMETQQLVHAQELSVQLYYAFHIQEHYSEIEQYILTELENLRLELLPLEEQIQKVIKKAFMKANIFAWCCLVLMSAHVGAFGRLTWWEYSWDIMEPITYFVTFGTAMSFLIYFILTQEEYILYKALQRRRLKELYKLARKEGFSIENYNALKNRTKELQDALKIIRGPLYDTKLEIQRKKQRYSSSSSKSPSSSPSPSPSPERDVPKRAMHVTRKDDKFS